jgi:hypothetical protein
MTISKRKILNATVLAYAFTLGGVQSFGQLGGLNGSQKPAGALPDADDGQAALIR